MPSHRPELSPCQTAPGALHLSLLHEFGVRDRDSQIAFPRGVQRLLAFLALSHRAVKRAQVAGALWPEVDDCRASGSLRSELWRLQQVAPGAVVASSHELELSKTVAVDFHDATALADRLLYVRQDLRPSDLCHTSIRLLSLDLLPDWYDDWVVTGAESWRQLRLHALEALAEVLMDRGNHLEALQAALAAVHAERLRESAYALVVRIHLSEGNQSEAIRTYQGYRDLLRAELGLEPTDRLRRLLPHQDAR